MLDILVLPIVEVWGSGLLGICWNISIKRRDTWNVKYLKVTDS